jgi:uncharacterized protein YbaR (Trm112 family)
MVPLESEQQSQDIGLPGWLLALLVCPIDKSELNQISSELVCATCGRRYPIRNGIPIMTPESAESER